MPFRRFGRGSSSCLGRVLTMPFASLARPRISARWRLARLLQAMASAAASDDERREEALEDASRRLEAEGEPLAIGFGLLARSHLARTQGRMEEARRLAQAAYDQAAPIGESFMRMIASVELAHAGGWVRRDEPGRTPRSRIAAGSTTPPQPERRRLCARAVGGGRAPRRSHRARRLAVALSDRSYRQAGSHPWRTTSELHDQVHKELQVALGDRYEQILVRARNVDLDDALTELISAQPSAH